MLSTASAVKNVNVGHATVTLGIPMEVLPLRGRIPGFDFMVFRMAAARSYLLVLFKSLNIPDRKKALDLGNLDAFAGDGMPGLFVVPAIHDLLRRFWRVACPREELLLFVH